MRWLAQFISIIFHPLLFTTYLVFILGWFNPSLLMIRMENLRLVVIFVFCFTFVLPGINLVMFRYFGNITSLHMRTQQERIWPFIFIALTYTLVTFLFYFKLPFSENFNKLMLVVSILVVAATISTFIMKVSVHSLAMMGMLSILFWLNNGADSVGLWWLTIGLTLVSGIVMSARLYLNAHTLNEVLWGGLIGLVVGSSVTLILY